MKRIFYLIASTMLLSSALFLNSCDKEKETQEDLPPTAKTVTIDASGYDKWIYFSFSQGKIVSVDNYKSDMTWDMALHRYDVRLNGGLSSEVGAKGCALATNSSNLGDISIAPESGYSYDTLKNITLDVKDMENPVYEMQPVNLVVSEWMKMDASKMPPSYTLSNKVYVVRTHDGKYVKIKFTDYLDETAKKVGHITFSYVYQEDGSRNF